MAPKCSRPALKRAALAEISGLESPTRKTCPVLGCGWRRSVRDAQAEILANYVQIRAASLQAAKKIITNELGVANAGIQAWDTY
jgi:dihydroorotate dehydrogenase